MGILSIQSHVSYGHVGNAAATFPLQRLGFEVWPVHTVLFSNHTGYGDWQGPTVAPADVAAVIQGIDDRGVLPTCQAVLSGYVGAAQIGAVIGDAIARVRAANPKALVTCDPVIGDVGRGIFVRPGIPEFLRDTLVPAADVVTPNQFETEWLTGRPCRTLDEALAAADTLRALGPDTVLITSLDRIDDDPTVIEMLAVSGDGAWLVGTPRYNLPVAPNGSGDATAAIFTAKLLSLGSVPDALAATAACLDAIFAATHAAGTRELQIVAAGDAIAAPATTFNARQVR